ncbi:MAG: outer membrane beta-barrel protein [Bacteroidales bacterium]|nr:outer membrane beta-barrel protein [Bacteroidales bacterium]
MNIPKKILWLPMAFCLYLSVFHSASAQRRFDASLFAGLNMCQIDGDQAGNYSHPGLRTGVGTSFSLSSDSDSPWRMVVELAYTAKGSYNKEYNTSLDAGYVELPLLLSYTTLERRLRIAAGVAPAVKVRARFKNGSDVDSHWDDFFSVVDWLPLTVTLRYLVTDHLGLEGRFQYSALSVADDAPSGTYFLLRSNKGLFHNLVNIGLTYTF